MNNKKRMRNKKNYNQGKIIGGVACELTASNIFSRY